MPLLTSQKEFIVNSIDHLICSLPTEEKALHEAGENLKKAFNKELSETNELFGLQQCIHVPELYLRRIEEFNAQITIGEIQEYLLFYIDKTIMEKCALANINKSDLHWDKNALLSKIQQNPSFAKTFLSEPLAITDESDLYALNLPGRVYKASLIPDIMERSVDLKIIATVDDQIFTLSFMFEEYPDLEMADEEFDHFISNLYEPAEIEAENEVMDLVNNFFTEEKNGFPNIQFSDSALKLLTYQFYFDYFKKNKNDLYLINTISHKQLKSLIEPSIIKLIKDNKIPLKDAKNLSKLECYNLKCIFINYLLYSNKISLIQAKKISEGGNKLLSNEYYYQQFLLDNIPFNAIENFPKHLAKLICLPEIVQLVSRNIISLFSLTTKNASLLSKNPIIYFLFSEKYIDLNQLLFFSDMESEMLVIHLKEKIDALKNIIEKWKELNKETLGLMVNVYINLLRKNILEINSFEDMFNNLETFCKTLPQNTPNAATHLLLNHPVIKSYAKIHVVIRLQSLLSNTPETLSDKSKDQFSILFNNANEFSIPIYELMHKEVIRRVMLRLRGINDKALDPILEHSTSMGMPLVEIWAHYFSQRLFGIFNKRSFTINKQTDSIKLILEEILQKEETKHLSLLHTTTLKFFLKLLKEDLELSFKTSENSTIYLDIYHEILNASETKLLPSGKVLMLGNWNRTFQNLLILAHNELEKEKEPEAKSDFKRARLNFSSHFYASQPAEPLDFCKRLLSLEEIIKPLNEKNCHLKMR